MEMWFNIQYYTYLLLTEQGDPAKLEAKFTSLIDQQLGPVLEANGGSVRLFLQPLASIHLFSHLRGEIGVNGDITYVYVFSAIAGLILLIACFNFINLSTARSAARSKETGVKKTLGADRKRLILQFLGESVFYSLISQFLALILIELALPHFNLLFRKELELGLLSDPGLLSALIGFGILVGIAAGLYPSLFLSSFRPAKVLRASMGQIQYSPRLRKILVTAQFTIVITLIVCSLVINAQLKFVKNKDLGIKAQNVLVVPNVSKAILSSIETVKSELKSIPGVINTGVSSLVPSRGYQLAIVLPEGFSEDQRQTVNLLNTDDEFVTTMGIELAAGRDFSPDYGSEALNSVLINETAALEFGWDEPLGKTITMGVRTDTAMIQLDRKVVGVVKDFHQKSLHDRIEPMVIGNVDADFSAVSIKISEENSPRIIEEIEQKFKQLESNKPFHYFYLDDSITRSYTGDDKLQDIILYFSFLAVFVGCLGLMGMSSYATERRAKEIGIRKIWGATVLDIFAIFQKETVILLAISCALAIPISYYSMQKWITTFAYRTDISPAIYVNAVLLTALLACSTVTYQTLKAALANPVISLRNE